MKMRAYWGTQASEGCPGGVLQVPRMVPFGAEKEQAAPELEPSQLATAACGGAVSPAGALASPLLLRSARGTAAEGGSACGTDLDRIGREAPVAVGRTGRDHVGADSEIRE